MVFERNAAYVPRAGGPPDTTGYMWGGYAIVLVIYGAYTALLLRRRAQERRAGQALGPAISGTRASGTTASGTTSR